MLLTIHGDLTKVVVSKEYIYQRTWNHACWIHGKDKNILFSNGNLVATVNSTMTAQDNSPFPAADEMKDSAFILGQDQGKIRSGFSIRKMFQGSLSELNIWDKELTEDEILNMNKCKAFPKGNIVTWEKQNLQLNEAEFKTVSNKTYFCIKKEFYVSPKKIERKEASDNCVSMGGQVAAPTNEEENIKILELIKKYPECVTNGNSLAWIGVEKKANTVTWKQVGRPNNNALFNKLGPDRIKELENDAEDICITIKSDGSWNTYHDCNSVTNSIFACNVCQFDRTPSFLAKGFCPNSPANWIYYLVQNGSEYFFEGYKRNKVIKTSEGWTWVLDDGSTILKLKPYTGGPIG